MSRMLYFTVALASAVASARADQYWVAYEGNDFPENEGWSRLTSGGGADRSLNEGVLVLDGRASIEIADFYRMDLNGNLDAGPGEDFLAQWRFKIEDVIGLADAAIEFRSDDSLAVLFRISEDKVRNFFEPGNTTEITADVFHEFEFRSPDMRSYELFIDGELGLSGEFRPGVLQSVVSWGDGTQGASSLEHWDYFRFGVVPADPCSDVLCGDCNCDGSFDGADIDTFFLTLVDPEAWQEAFPKCDRTCIADINGDESVDAADIDAFFQALAVGQCP